MTVRRLLVFGVCALGVTSLYLVPALSRPPQQGTQPGPRSQPTVRPSTSTAPEPPASADDRTRARPRSSPAGAPTERPTEAAPEESPTVSSAEPPREPVPDTPQPTRTGATAFDPTDRRDGQAPEPVAELTSTEISPTALTLRWAPADDNVGVAEYRVVLDGFEVASTPKTSATVRWFNDDARDHIVQVRAVDAAGNESPASPGLLVARPTPGPTPSPEPSEPTLPPEPTPSPTPSPSDQATAPAQGGDETSAGEAGPPLTPNDEEN